MKDEQIREALNAHWHASATGDVNDEHNIYDAAVICDYPNQASESLDDIMEFRNGKVAHETQYFANPFEAPAWRSQWVQPIT